MQRKGFIVIAVLMLMIFATSSVFAATPETDKRHEPTVHKHSSDQHNHDKQNKDAANNKDEHKAGMGCMNMDGMSAAIKDKMAGHAKETDKDAVNNKDGHKAGMGCMNQDGMSAAMKDKMAGHVKSSEKDKQ